MSDYIRMEHITKRFPGVTASADVSIGFARGEIHALLGENGAGKSTLMNMLYGLLKPDEGQITITAMLFAFALSNSITASAANPRNLYFSNPL